jgi:plastocyanin domain-containing protein
MRYISQILLFALPGLILAGCSASPKPAVQPETGVDGIKVTVTGEYSPARIVVKKDQPVRLRFYREDDSECTAQVVFEDFQIKQDLAVRKETVVELTPTKEGEFVFVCGMGMMKGKLVVEQ